MGERSTSGAETGVRCARDSDWCDGVICRENGMFPDCPNADPPASQECALCHGDGEIVNPLNADPAVKVTDWHYPVGCPRCGQTGKDPNP